MKELKEQRFSLMMEPSLVDQIDNYRFASRVGSRAEAARILIKAALAETKTATSELAGSNCSPFPK